MMTTLFRNGRLYSAADPRATALMVRGTRIAWLGSDADAPAADVTIDLAGALVAPAFVDAHVHTTDTGIAMLGLDLAGTRSAGEVLDRVASHAEGLPSDAVLVGHGLDESTWSPQQQPCASELDRAGGGRSVYLSRDSLRAGVSSAIVSTSLLHQAHASTPGTTHAGGFATTRTRPCGS